MMRSECEAAGLGDPPFEFRTKFNDGDAINSAFKTISCIQEV